MAGNPQVKDRKSHKPQGCPLTPHPNGQWSKKINGRVCYFGVWADLPGAPLGRCDLETLAERYTDLKADKADAHRLRFDEIDGEDLRLLDRGLLQYALADAICTWHSRLWQDHIGLPNR